MTELTNKSMHRSCHHPCLDGDVLIGNPVMLAVLPSIMKQKFKQLNDAERQWISNSIANAQSLVAATSADDAGKEMTPEILDHAYKSWLNRGLATAEQANDVIHAIAFAFGQYLVDRDGFDWTLVTDQFGTDIGMRALPNRGDVLVCPASMVAKRWESKETDFLSAIYRAVIEHRNSIRDSWDSKKISPWWKIW
jgi:hypothetical protein